MLLRLCTHILHHSQSSYLLKPPSANIGAQPSTAAPATDSPTHLDEVQVDDTMSHPDLNPGRIDLIHRGVDTSFYHKTWNSHGLNTNWSSLAGNFVFEPVSLLWGPDLVYVFGVDFSSCIQYKFLHKLTGKWSENWIELKAIRAPATAEGGESKPIRWAAKPSVISLYPKSMEIVGLGSDNNLYHGSWALGSGWSCFTALVSDIHFREPPSLTSWSAGRFDVFALGLDGNVYHKRWVKKGWSPFTHTGNSRSSSLASSTLDSEWEADIKGRGRSGLSENSKSSQSMEVSTWENLQGPFMHTPSAVSWAKGRIDLVGIAGGGKVYHKFWDEDSQAWSSKWKDVGMTSEPVGRPEIVSWGPNRLDLFIIGSDRAIYHKWLNASGNTQWEPFEQDESLLGRTLGDQVTAASIGPNNLAVFCTKMDCRMFAKSWTPDQWSVSKDTGSGYSALEGHATARIVACATRNVMFNP